MLLRFPAQFSQEPNIYQRKMNLKENKQNEEKQEIKRERERERETYLSKERKCGVEKMQLEWKLQNPRGGRAVEEWFLFFFFFFSFLFFSTPAV